MNTKELNDWALKVTGVQKTNKFKEDGRPFQVYRVMEKEYSIWCPASNTDQANYVLNHMAESVDINGFFIELGSRKTAKELILLSAGEKMRALHKYCKDKGIK